MNKTVTLLEFLESTGADVKIYDIGRRVSRIRREHFLKFENQQIPYPYPLQQQAWFGLSIFDKDTAPEPVFWFLRFPLDETGKLQQAGRDYFIHRLFEASTSAHDQEENLSQDALKDNPHVFKPRDDKMAIFHACLSNVLKQPASRFYGHAREYFSGNHGWEQWNFVGFQGIADLAERLDQDSNENLVIMAIPHLPQQPLEALCQCLENRETSLAVTEMLLKRAEHELQQNTPSGSIAAHLIRAVSQSVSTNSKELLIESVLSSPIASDADVLSAISARSWEWLENETHAKLYLEKLATSEQVVFNDCLSDLLFMPRLRNKLLSVIRSPLRSDQLAESFNNLIKAFS